MGSPNSEQSKEASFVSGASADGTVAAQSYWTWQDDSPATYGTTAVYSPKWGGGTAGRPVSLTFGFDAASNWTDVERSAFGSVMALWSAVGGLTFSEVASGANITFTRGSTGGAYASLSYSGQTSVGSTVFSRMSNSISVVIDTSVAGFGPIGTSFTNYGGYPWTTMIHEVGHALGLGHGGTYPVTGVTTAPYTAYDSNAYTVMSYLHPQSSALTGISPLSFSWGVSLSDNGSYYRNYEVTPQMLDIVAIQRLYGAPTTTPLSGGQVFGFNTNITGPIRNFFDFTVNTKPVVTLFNTGTGNSLDLSGFTQGAKVDLHDGAFSSAGGLTNNIAIAFGTRIDAVVTGNGSDTIVANDNGDTITSGAGNDTITGGAGNDAVTMGANFDLGDRIDLGAGSNDQVAIQGDYTGTRRLALGAATLLNVEVLSVMPGFSYDITSNNANVAAGAVFTIFGGNLAAGNALSFNGAGETDGAFRMYGGLGTDSFTGGAGSDGFYFGPGRYSASDQVHGGPGSDQLALDGDYALTLTSREDVETFVMLPGTAGSPAHYAITVADSFAPAGQARTLFGLAVTTPLAINAGAELDAPLTIYGGQAGDAISGGQAADLIFGGGGGDALSGGGGADVFLFDAAAQSTSTGFDRISDFAYGTDVLRIRGQAHDAYATVNGGTLSNASFDADLAAATGGLLANGSAVIFNPSGGDWAGHHFLIVDANGIAGYQPGGDYVIQLPDIAPPTNGLDFITL